jgi:hypothetical protein
MSKYDDHKALFLSPKVTQYDGHMVMTNVVKPTKTKYVNVDTSFRDEYSDYNSNSLANCTVTLPERITEVKSIQVRNIEIPISMYNISEAIGNHCFKIENGATSRMVILPDGQYTASTISSAINSAIQSLPSPLNRVEYSVTSGLKSAFDPSNTSVILNFAVTATGAFDAYNLKKKLGWVLGFRIASYTVVSTKTTSEGIVDLSGFRYLYLVLDEFTKGNQNSFIAALPSSLVRKQILARISIDKNNFPFGTILPANNYNGYLLTDRREYSGRVDLQKLNIQLVDDIGKPVSLNGQDYSFCLEVEHE